MNAIIEERYFEWLYAHVHDPDIDRREMTYWKLLRQLHNKEFVYTVLNDDNRWQDGRELRDEFRADFEELTLPEVWLGLPCSMLEMLVALTKRLEFQTDEPMEGWFWHLLENIGIAQYNDVRYSDEAWHTIDAALDRVIFRKYSYSGRGGLFPLGRADRDQRQLEIWFQMHMYLLES